LALFIVRVKFAVRSDDLLKPRMWKPPLYPHDDRLRHLAGEHFAHALLSMAAVFQIGCLYHSHYFAMLFRSWVIRVSTRALSRRNSRKLAGFSNWLLACWKRRLHFSCRRSRL